MKHIIQTAIAALAGPLSIVFAMIFAELVMGGINWANIDLIIYLAIGLYIALFVGLLFRRPNDRSDDG